MTAGENESKWTPDYKFCRITGAEGEAFSMAYLDSGGNGEPVLFLHEFASFSYTWEKMLSYLPGNRRYLRLDSIGFGYTIYDWEKNLSSYDQAEQISHFILKLNLSCLTIVGHGMGGEIALLLMNNPLLRVRVKQLVLIACGALEQNLPEYIENIARSSLTRPVLRLVHSGFLARMMLEYAYGGNRHPDPDTVKQYAAMLNIPGRTQSILAAARCYSLPVSVPQDLQLPVTVICGDADPVYPLEASEHLAQVLKPSRLQVIPGCGHLPQEECPRETAQLIYNMLSGSGEEPSVPSLAEKVSPAEKTSEAGRTALHMRRLFDYWNLGSIFIIVTLKMLQFFRHLGIRAETHGWRKVTGIFLKKECSKFVIASFRLSYCSPFGAPKSFADAREVLISRLKQFLIDHTELHWAVELNPYLYRSRKQNYCDVMEAEVDHSGRLLSLTPHFDDRHSALLSVSQEQLDWVLKSIIEVYNERKDSAADKRYLLIFKELKRKIRKRIGFSVWKRGKFLSLADRIMTASFLYFEVLPEHAEEARIKRFKTPDFRRFRHPGWGLLCIAVRFTSDFSEADLWWQFNHVSVDGAPMQDTLGELKRLWGSAGSVVYPAMNGIITAPETMYCGDHIFRSRFYVDFSGIMRLRKYLNGNFLNEMNGSASFAGLLMWGLARHPFFQSKKMLLPVDWIDEKKERELGLLIIRPGVFDRQYSTDLMSFLHFQREMNRRLAGIRRGCSESLEFLALCTMLHPMMYMLVKKIAPASLGEVVGTMGISIIRDAEVFVSPLTDLQINGFMSLGSTSIRTADGRTAGSVCICGSREQIECYYHAIRFLVEELPGILMPRHQ